MRADIWLWAARFFKTRALAKQALAAGKIACGGVACKPARLLRVGERLDIARGEERFEIEVLALANTRGPATMAQTLYRESPASSAARAALREQRRLQQAGTPQPPPARPGKRDRRRIHAFKQGL
ncbi:RNA-binding S4 domain-containing protein [Metallibacterium scheffleri]|uniref:RNA-binding protein n=1 Tax=Metallibacterium scheffleri TaxID=993689 RepID=A0A4S3KNF8_9GAMM|nr:RNA-binding S4 domain-containing protein [Metallibacterium scheffleri]THD10492.1 RNA-binding protein [Metallibacterium scheffleri]